MKDNFNFDFKTDREVDIKKFMPLTLSNRGYLTIRPLCTARIQQKSRFLFWAFR